MPGIIPAHFLVRLVVGMRCVMKLLVYSLSFALLTACGVDRRPSTTPKNVIPQWYKSEDVFAIADITDSCTLTPVMGETSYTVYDSIDDKLYVYRTQADCLAKTNIKCSLFFPLSKSTCYVPNISEINGKEVAGTYIRAEEGLLIVISWLMR